MRKLIFAGLLSLFSLTNAKAQCSSAVMETFGATSSIALYNTYVSIGAIADGYVGESYDSDYTVTLMDEQLAMMSVLAEYIDDLLKDSKSGISMDDKEYLKEMKACLKDLCDEAQSLKDYATSGSENGSDKYDAARTAAWAKISNLLGLDQD